MSWRRFLMLAAVMLLAVSVVSTLAGSRDRSGAPAAPREAIPARPSSVVEGTLPSDRAIRARVGDVVRLTVSSPAADVVELADLAVEQPVDPSFPAQLEFVADQPGRFVVRLREAGEAIGTVRVVGT